MFLTFLVSVTQALHLSLLWALESNGDGDSLPLKALLVAQTPGEKPSGPAQNPWGERRWIWGSWNL